MHRHEGSESILAHLKERGWATSLSAGEGSGSFSARSFFNVRVTLTDEGVRLRLGAMTGHTRQTPTCISSYPAVLCHVHVKMWRVSFCSSSLKPAIVSCLRCILTQAL